MKKTFSLFLLLSLCCLSLMAQNLEVKRSDYNQLSLHFQASQPIATYQKLFNHDFTFVGMEGFSSTTEVGQPQLPIYTQMVEVPLCNGFSYTIVSATYDTIEGATLGINHPIVPAQPSRSKSDRSTPVLHQDSETYSLNAFVAPHQLFNIEKVGVARNRNLALVEFCPMQYNPTTNQVIICKNLDININFVQPDIAGTEEMAQRYNSGAFSTGMKIANQLPCTKEISNAQAAPIHYLIVAHSMFRGQLDEFIAWKQRKGFLVTVGYTDQAEVGTSRNSIQAYIKSFYTNATASLPAPTYLLLVGDNEQIPAFDAQYGYSGPSTMEDHITDLYYATWTNGDIIPDCYYGRFSAQNAIHLTPQIEKTLMYEQYTFADPSFLNRAVLIAGVDQGYSTDNAYRCADPAMDYIAKTYINADHGFTTVSYYKNNTSFAPDGVTVTGSSQSDASASAIRNLYSQGAGWINYSAHGDVDMWYQPRMTNNQVNQMTNSQKFGFVIGSCCLTNSFQETTCFGEAWLRKGNYCGAVTYFGGSNSTYWYEDFYWAVGVRSNINNTMNANYDANKLGVYDRLFHTHGEARNDWYTTAGSILMAGNMTVQSSSSSAKGYYWEIYHLMGDPSVMPWLGTAEEMNVQNELSTLMGSTGFEFTAVPYAYCALTDGNGTLISAAFADANGNVVLPLDDAIPGTYEVAISAQGYKTKFIPAMVIANDGPYVVVKGIEANLVAGSTAQFSLNLENIGNANTENLDVELIVDNNHLFLTGARNYAAQNIAAGASTTLSNRIPVMVWDYVADQTVTSVTVIVNWENGHSSRTFNLHVNAPKVAIDNYQVNGNLTAGATATLSLTNRNNGAADLTDATATLVCLDPAISISNSSNLGTIAAGGTATTTHTLTLSNNIPTVGQVTVYQIIEAGSVRYIDSIGLVFGTPTSEDFESGNFNNFAWEQNSYPWEITSSGAYAGTYCARSKTWGNSNGNGKDSELSIQYTSTINDSISFYYNVSSETGYDKFYFYIDNRAVLDGISGTSNNWTRFSYPVAAGTHTFKFSYQKDYSRNEGSDCAWIDNISFPLAGTQRSYKLDTVCIGNSYAMPNYTYAATHACDTILMDSTAHHLHFVKLSVVAAPNTRIEADHDHIYLKERVELTATGAQHYVWSNGATSEKIHVYPERTTTYSVTGYTGTCSSTAEITIVLLEGGIDGVEQAHLVAYPNPTSGRLVIENLAEGEVSLYDVTGRLVQRWITHESTMNLNISPLPQGIYILRNGGNTHKIVKNK